MKCISHAGRAEIDFADLKAKQRDASYDLNEWPRRFSPGIWNVRSWGVNIYQQSVGRQNSGHQELLWRTETFHVD